MMILSRRHLVSLAVASTTLPARTEAFFVSPSVSSRAVSFTTRTIPLGMAAPGVIVDSTMEIQKALTNPNAVVLDARRVDEIEETGHWHSHNRQWVHAPCTPDGACPLLDVAAESLLRDKEAPVIVYCASGKRATVAKNFLQNRGYKNVFNAGGYPGDFADLLQVQG